MSKGSFPINESLRGRCIRWIFPLMIVAAAISGLVWSWGTWPDAVVDFGRELYVPWRLSEGQTLYRDIVSFNGPLSNYALALWFKCFGASLRSLIFSNILVFAVVLFLLYEMFCRMAGYESGLLACLSFIAVFAFSQLHGIGNFNWMCPYSHELTHGIALSLLGIYMLFRFAKQGHLIWMAASGFILGLVFLTKAEVFLAGAMACVAAMAALQWGGNGNLKHSVSMWLVWVGCLCLPIGSAYLLLSLAMPANKALLSVMGTWPYVFNVEHRNLWFFKWIMGTLDLTESVARVLRWIGWYLLVFFPAGVLALICRRREESPLKLSITLFFLVIGLLLYLWLKHNMIQWLHVPQPWQIFTCLMMVVFGAQIIINRSSIQDLPGLILKLMMATFSFVLLGKIILNVRVWHYGFALAMPAGLMVVTALWRWIPEWLATYGGKTIVFRAVVLAVWLIAMAAHLKGSAELFSHKQYVVGSDYDSFRSDYRGHMFFEAVKLLEKNMKHGETLVALPEGVMMNYLLRVHSPTPFIYHTVPVMILFGEERMLSCLKNSPPDWVALVHRDDSAYGARFFGKDYGQSIWRWIAENYVFERRIGALPFQNENFGILIGKLRAKTPRFYQLEHSAYTFHR